MKKQIFAISSLLISAALLIGVISCKKDEEKVTFVLSGLSAGAINLNGATPPTDVPVDASITASFSVAVKASTATSANITLTRIYDQASIDLTITVSGSTVTINPTDNLGNGAMFELSVSGLQ